MKCENDSKGQKSVKLKQKEENVANNTKGGNLSSLSVKIDW